jgi:putative sigma-54 modulation protein
MNLQISGHHLEVTPAIRNYMTSKLERITRHFDQVIDMNAVLSIDNIRQKAEITLHVRGKDIHVESVDDDLYAAIDSLIDKLDRQVIRYKDKRQDHHHVALKRQDTMPDRETT